ncbi:MAG: phosphate acyltransferase PlsX [Lachnospiraceae bacterium]|nr:phosphate acyltransferase PlsX [Lachnospiraceae bacterium]MDY5742929.1 phosphate acyltransferase PlsX [Lachnospiraceae bacterium]
MRDRVRIVVDAMGGDHAPAEIIGGCVAALRESDRISLILTGRAEVIRRHLGNESFGEDRLQIIDARDVIETGEPPVAAIRRKKDSSIVIGMKLIRDGQADAFISAGSTGAVLVGGQLLVGRLPGVARAPLAPLLPTKKGFSLLIDCGANVDARPEHLVQFAKMGSLYMEQMLNIKQPKVGIVNVGVEEEKGNALVKETFPLLKACPDIRFAGSIEAREIPSGEVDVIVCEAFVGNVILKLFEGVALTMLGIVKKAIKSGVLSKIGGLLLKKPLKKELKQYVDNDQGGAPMLGLRGLVIKAHGNSQAKDIRNAIMQCQRFHETGLVEKMKEVMKEDI